MLKDLRLKETKMDKKHAELLNAVYIKTKERQARWAKGEQDRQYILRFSNGALVCEKYTNALTGTYYRYTLQNQDGDYLDELIVPENSSGYSLSQDLYNRVSRQEIGTDDLIDDMLGELSGDNVVGN
jgi:hypothetical protein